MANFKLVSREGTLLGVVTLPSDVSNYLEKYRSAEMAVIPSLPSIAQHKPDDLVSTSLRKVVFFLAYHPEIPGAVGMEGLTIEEFERLPNCSFSPSAAYLRTFITERE